MHSIYPWQQLEWKQINSRFQQQTLPHAFLLSGTKGMGKLDFAHAIAELLLCQQPKEMACGICTSCHLINAKTHPDLFIIQPEESGKNIKVNQIRELIEKLNQTAQQGKYQAVIIEPAEAMNIAAANALLKTLEEPRGQVALILVSHQSSLLPATIRSRCQKIVFKITGKQLIQEWLIQQLPTLKNPALLLAQTDCAPLRALELAQTTWGENVAELIKNFIGLASGEIDSVKLAALYAKENSQEILTISLLLISDLLKIILLQSSDFMLYKSHSEIIEKAAKRFSATNLFQLYDRFIEAKNLLAKNINLNPQLLLEDLFIDCQRLASC